jgi:hypothetical protein
MANPTLFPLATTTVGAGGVASVTFSSIPQVYTDLKVVVSARSASTSGTNVAITFNGSSSSLNMILLYGSGSAAASLTDSTKIAWEQDISTYTANTFGNAEAYIPNYTGSNYKSVGFDAVSENNATLAYAELGAGLWSNTSPITSITLTSSSANFVQYSTFTLFGVRNY